MFWPSLIWIFFSDFRYVTKYGNSDRNKLLVGKLLALHPYVARIRIFQFIHGLSDFFSSHFLYFQAVSTTLAQKSLFHENKTSSTRKRIKFFVASRIENKGMLKGRNFFTWECRNRQKADAYPRDTKTS